MLSMDFPSNLLVILPQFCWLIPFQSLQSWWFFNEISQSLISFIKLTDKVWLVDIEYLQVSKRMMTWKQFFFQPIHLRPDRQIGSSADFPGRKENMTDPMDGNVFNLRNGQSFLAWQDGSNSCGKSALVQNGEKNRVLLGLASPLLLAPNTYTRFGDIRNMSETKIDIRKNHTKCVSSPVFLR